MTSGVGQCNGEEQLGGLDNEKSMYDYVSDCDLYAILPVYWIECGKNRQELKKHIASEYLIDNEEIIGDIMSEVVDTYEQALAQKEDMVWDSGDHDDLDEEALFDLTLIEMFHEEEWSFRANEAYQNRESGVFFSVREADGEYVLNMGSCLSVIVGVIVVLTLGLWLAAVKS